MFSVPDRQYGLRVSSHQQFDGSQGHFSGGMRHRKVNTSENRTLDITGKLSLQLCDAALRVRWYPKKSIMLHNPTSSRR